MSAFKNLTNELEELISTASKANTQAISETTKFISQLDKSKLNMGTLREIEKKLLSETLLSFTKLNIKYVTDLIQLGVSLTKRLNENSSNAAFANESAPPKSSISAFEIKTNAVAGEMASAAFLLNSDKNEPIFCEVTNTGFYSTLDDTLVFDAPITYTPQAFELIKGNAQRVDILIPVPANVVSGSYKSLISVKGFEHVHFDLLLQVTAPINPPAETEKQAATAKAKKASATPKAKKTAAKKSKAVKKAKK